MKSNSLAKRQVHQTAISDAQISSEPGKPSLLSKILYVLTATMIIGLPLLMGAKDSTSEAIIKFLSFSSILTLLASRQKASLLQTVSNYRRLALPVSLLFALFILQASSLPLGLISLLAPETADLYKTVHATNGRISLAPYATTSQGVWLLALLSLLLVATCSVSTFKTLTAKLTNSSAILSFNPFAALFILGGTICTAIALAHWASGAESYFGIFGEDRTAQTRRAHWPFVNPNHLSIYLQMSFAFCFAAFLEQCSSIKQRLNARLYRRRHATGKEVRRDVVLAFGFGLIAFFLAVGNLLTASRMGNVLLLLGGAGLLWFHFRSDKALGLVTVLPIINKPLSTKTRRLLVAALVLTFAISIVAITGQTGQQLAKERIAYGLTTSFDDVRLILVSASAQIISSFPIFGSGLGAWHVAAQAYVPKELAGFRLDYAHNDALQFIAETGLVGFVLLALLAKQLLGSLTSKWNSLKLAEEKRGFTASIVAITLPVTHSLVDFPFHVPALAVGIALLLAALLTQSEAS